MANYTLCSLLFETKPDYVTNLNVLVSEIEKTSENSFVVAPEVCLTGFDYDNFNAAAAFREKSVQAIKEVSQNKIIVLTLIKKKGNDFFNMAIVIHNGALVYERAKARLFRFGGEEKYFTQGKTAELETITIDGLKIAFLVCFELRFKELWKLCEGADIIAVPSWWGVLRANHFKSLTQTLAIMNQCYVVASDSGNKECSKLSGIIDPKGEALYNNNKSCLQVQYSQKEITLMRRYIDVGLNN